MDTLADRLEQVIVGVLDRHNATTSNKRLSELIRMQVAQVLQEDARISRYEPSAAVLELATRRDREIKASRLIQLLAFHIGEQGDLPVRGVDRCWFDSENRCIVVGE